MSFSAREESPGGWIKALIGLVLMVCFWYYLDFKKRETKGFGQSQVTAGQMVDLRPATDTRRGGAYF